MSPLRLGSIASPASQGYGLSAMRSLSRVSGTPSEFFPPASLSPLHLNAGP